METFWAAALALSLALYVLLDGFDLGIGILYAFAPGERARNHMMEAIAPVWDGNETWLIIAGATLFGAFPLAYSILVSAFYLPVILMLSGLILRGVAFEYRHKASKRTRWLWSASFCGGSILAAFMQGCAIGAFVRGLPVEGQHFTGTVLTWASPYALLCGLGLVLGYALLGASWLVHKTRSDVRDFGYHAMPYLFGGLAVFLAVAAVWIFAAHYRIADRWFERPYLFIVLAVGVAAGAGLVLGWWRGIDRLPLPMTMLMFAAAFLTMVLSVLPYMVPFSLTIGEVVAPHATLAFLFWFAGIVVLPLTLIYTAAVYWLFRGRVRHAPDDSEAHDRQSEASDYRREYAEDATPHPAMRLIGQAEQRVEAHRRALGDALDTLKKRFAPPFLRSEARAWGTPVLLLIVFGGAGFALWQRLRRSRRLRRRNALLTTSSLSRSLRR